MVTSGRTLETTRHHDRAIAHLIERHEQLERAMAARTSHGLSTDELWSAIVAIESRLAEVSPRAHAFWIAQWAQPLPVAQHEPEQCDPQYPLCAAQGDRRAC